MTPRFQSQGCKNKEGWCFWETQGGTGLGFLQILIGEVPWRPHLTIRVSASNSVRSVRRNGVCSVFRTPSWGTMFGGLDPQAMMFNLLGIIEGSMPGKSRTISLDLSRAMLASGSSPKLDRRVSPPSSAKSRCFVRLRSPTLRPPAKHAHHHRGVHACRGKALQF